MNVSQPRLREGALDLKEWLSKPAPPECGALAVFAGTVRNVHEGRAVRGLNYSAYAPLAEARLAQIERETAQRFQVHVEVAHSVGELQIGDVSVVVVVRAGHRGAAFEACRWTIDTIKQAVPIWKEERYQDGTACYLEGTPLKGVSES
jgi:molybdopterin synthase catalytic subunit